MTLPTAASWGPGAPRKAGSDWTGLGGAGSRRRGLNLICSGGPSLPQLLSGTAQVGVGAPAPGCSEDRRALGKWSILDCCHPHSHHRTRASRRGLETTGRGLRAKVGRYCTPELPYVAG